jgi:hypothetical protein
MEEGGGSRMALARRDLAPSSIFSHRCVGVPPAPPAPPAPSPKRIEPRRHEGEGGGTKKTGSRFAQNALLPPMAPMGTDGMNRCSSVPSVATSSAALPRGGGWTAAALPGRCRPGFGREPQWAAIPTSLHRMEAQASGMGRGSSAGSVHCVGGLCPHLRNKRIAADHRVQVDAQRANLLAARTRPIFEQRIEGAPDGHHAATIRLIVKVAVACGPFVRTSRTWIFEDAATKQVAAPCVGVDADDRSHVVLLAAIWPQ